MKNSQSGRSMVEMLGVLAIIGVLSIGGIAGYTLSMRRFRVNNVLDLVNKYALTTYSACQSKMLINPTSFSKVDSCSGDKNVAFTSSGLGEYPNGVTEIATPTFTEASNKSTTGTAGVVATSDKVDIAITFNDVELCKTAASITGGTVSSAGDNNCVASTKKFTFTVYMN